MTTTAQFDIHYRQYLDQEGAFLPEVNQAALPAFTRDPAELLKMYRMMTLVRTFDTKAVNLQRTGKLGTYPPALGHEAAQVGAAAALRPEDVIAPVYREIGTQIWRGVRMVEILRYWGGDEEGNNFVNTRHDFPWCVPIATQTLHAAGAAMAFQIRKEPRCALAYIGDGGTSEGAFYEAMNVAGVRKLPVVFYVVNNRWAISIPLEQQTAAQTLAQKGIAAGIPGIQVDGNDILAVRDVLEQALQRARSGQGPTVVEALTYRLSDHTTADDASRYRPAGEIEQGWALEPMKRLRAYLTRLHLWDDSQEQALKQECSLQVETAVREYLATPRPPVTAMFDHLFANMPKRIAEQRDQALTLSGATTHHG
ncbi:MAG: pyruvate dehydrogenase (acetyl-transferring) E1 component subunit alpha [Steroidobacteraceae bacterium]